MNNNNDNQDSYKFKLVGSDACSLMAKYQSQCLHYAPLSSLRFLIATQFQFGLLHLHQFQYLLHIPSSIISQAIFIYSSFAQHLVTLTSSISHPYPSYPFPFPSFINMLILIRLIIDKELISSIPHHYSIIQQLTSLMSKFLKSNREEIKSKIFNKLNLSNTDDSDGYVDRESLRQENSQEHLDKMMKETEKRKLSIRKMINSSNAHADFSDEMTQLKWRIDALKNFSRNQKQKMLMAHKSTSLTGKPEESPQRELSFDEMYELQKRKFALLRQRRKTKINDPKYVDMIGNMQLRKEKRKTQSKVKVEDQMRILNQKIQQKID